MPTYRKMPKLMLLVMPHIAAITLCPFGIYMKEHYLEDTQMRRHEGIHWQQQVEMLIIPFYVWYFVEWLIRLVTNTRNAYRMISFEQEAYKNEKNPAYKRNGFDWLKYI